MIDGVRKILRFQTKSTSFSVSTAVFSQIRRNFYGIGSIHIMAGCVVLQVSRIPLSVLYASA